MTLRCLPLLQYHSTLQPLFIAIILRLAYNASDDSFLACYSLLAQLWQVIQFFWPWTCKTEQLCFVTENLRGIPVLTKSLLSSFQGTVRDKLKHITVLSIFILPHLYRSGSTIPSGSTACTYRYWIASQLQRADPRTSVSLLAASRQEIAERSTCECPLKTCPVFCSLFCFSFCHREFFKSQKEVALAFSKPSAS